MRPRSTLESDRRAHEQHLKQAEGGEAEELEILDALGLNQNAVAVTVDQGAADLVGLRRGEAGEGGWE